MSHERTDHIAHSTGTVLAFIAGACAGAAIALIFAPATGSEARAALADRGRRAVDKGRDVLDKGRDVLDKGLDAVDRGRDVLHDQANRVRSAIDRGREQVDAFGARVERAVEEGRDAIQTVRG